MSYTCISNKCQNVFNTWKIFYAFVSRMKTRLICIFFFFCTYYIHVYRKCVVWQCKNTNKYIWIGASFLSIFFYFIFCTSWHWQFEISGKTYHTRPQTFNLHNIFSNHNIMQYIYQSCQLCYRARTNMTWLYLYIH
jgi:glycosyltransferase involved in cell wall biosynthesis